MPRGDDSSTSCAAAITSRPPAATFTSDGSASDARGARVPLSTQPKRPFPTTVEIVPRGEIARMRLFFESAK